jgi:hypothetical protein
MASPFRASARSKSTWKLCVLVLAVGLFSLATLAKHSFSLPRSNGSHWISQTCKIRDSRRPIAVQAVAFRAAVTVLGHDRLAPVEPVVFRSAPLPLRVVDSFSSASLRSPPVSL